MADLKSAGDRRTGWLCPYGEFTHDPCHFVSERKHYFEKFCLGDIHSC